MKKMLIKNIGFLLQVRETGIHPVPGKEMKHLPMLTNAWLAVEDGLIADYGTMEEWPGISDWQDLEVIDADGKIIMPAFCDAHTHIVYAGSREGEFVDRISGLSYTEIAQRGGGILHSAAKLNAATEEELYKQAAQRLKDMINMGTGAVEIKSGYGLSLESELKMLRVIKKLKENFPICIKATFLGAHAVPGRFKNNRQGYIDEILNHMIPAVAQEKLADFCDVFCETGYFNRDETINILQAASAAGMRPKVHAEQLSHSGGIEAGVTCGAISVDHLEFISEQDMAILLNSGVVPVILPGAAFFLNLPFPPVRRMMEQNLPVALSTDYNPGSSPTGNMQLMLSISCIQYRMLPAEAINAATLNAACAMGVQEQTGSITRGKRANLILTRDMPSPDFMAYTLGNPWIDKVFINGQVFGAN